MKLIEFLKFVPVLRPICIINEDNSKHIYFTGTPNELIPLAFPFLSLRVCSTYADENLLVISITKEV